MYLEGLVGSPGVKVMSPAWHVSCANGYWMTVEYQMGFRLDGDVLDDAILTIR